MQWKHANSPSPRKCCICASAGKVMATIFWDAEEILLINYLEHGKTITGKYYAELIAKLRQAIKSKRRGMLRRGVLFHQDNAPAHKARVSIAAINESGFELVDHPPYSPDLAPSHFFLFPKMKEHLRGQKFSGDDELMSAVNDWLEVQDKEFFLRGIQALEHRRTKCVNVRRDYVNK